MDSYKHASKHREEDDSRIRGVCHLYLDSNKHGFRRRSVQSIHIQPVRAGQTELFLSPVLHITISVAGRCKISIARTQHSGPTSEAVHHIWGVQA